MQLTLKVVVKKLTTTVMDEGDQWQLDLKAVKLR